MWYIYMYMLFYSFTMLPRSLKTHPPRLKRSSRQVRCCRPPRLPGAPRRGPRRAACRRWSLSWSARDLVGVGWVRGLGGWEVWEGWGFGVALKQSVSVSTFGSRCWGVVVSASTFSMVWGRSCSLQVWGMGWSLVRVWMVVLFRKHERLPLRNEPSCHF